MHILTVAYSHPTDTALTAALQSTEGRAAAGDIDNFADGGATIFVQHD